MMEDRHHLIPFMIHLGVVKKLGVIFIRESFKKKKFVGINFIPFIFLFALEMEDIKVICLPVI